MSGEFLHGAGRAAGALAAILLASGLVAGCATGPAPEPVSAPPPPPPDYGSIDFEPVQFASGQVRPSPDALDRLRLVAVRLNRPDVVGRTIVLAGHTDGRGAATRNREVSMRRAEAVLDALAENGVDRGRARLVAHGEDLPVGDDSTRDGRAMNRRVEISLDP